MKIIKTACLVAAASLVLSGCAKSSQNIEAIETSPVLYQGLSCSQISTEAARVSTRANEVAGIQDKRATNDAVATGIALVLFWPAAFFVGGNNESAAELAQLKGQLNALEAASQAKNCGIVFKRIETTPDSSPKA